jgi:hypothetical protein
MPIVEVVLPLTDEPKLATDVLKFTLVPANKSVKV